MRNKNNKLNILLIKKFRIIAFIYFNNIFIIK